jgi:hypothetical protein
MRLLVCGGREYTDEHQINTALDQVCEKYKLRPADLVVIHGGAVGTDRLAKKWAILNGATDEPYYPEYKAYGKQAPLYRNQRMIDIGKPDRALVFPGQKGTLDMATRLVKAGIPILRWDV